jgi:AcrR family transcriptional regulator
MDELVRATGLGKMTVYRLFPTKDALVGAYLRRRSAALLKLIDEEIAQHAGDPRAAIMAVMDAVERDVSRDDFRGCPFNNASVEFDDPSHPARLAAIDYKRGLYDRLSTLAEQLRPGCGQVLAARLHLLIDGMYLSAGILGKDGPAAHGRALAELLLDVS